MNCNLEKVIDNIDHICQLAGNSSCMLVLALTWMALLAKNNLPMILRRSLILQKIPGLLKKRGYADDEYQQHDARKLVEVSPESMEQ